MDWISTLISTQYLVRRTHIVTSEGRNRYANQTKRFVNVSTLVLACLPG